MEELNRFFLMMIGYHLVLSKNKLWVQILPSQYKWEATLPFFRVIIVLGFEKEFVRLEIIFERAWDWSQFGHLISHDAVNTIATIVPPMENDLDDVHGWKWNPQRNFNVKSAYPLQADRDSRWKVMWKFNGGKGYGHSYGWHLA
ncbi:hypothetical protein J1N35_033899 [Gossypium stocksii]|uniref:Uncharacterized protein n=1 Tax=Gossypium stocksii TaxID=47602 RepID=A0A9D3USZ4_9ROSI|nr:hypothetical protein J1N35_033899 [Gossypium stocksii]